MEILKSMFLLTRLACRQYWSSEQTCLERKVWMSSFLSITSSRPEVSCKKVLLNFFAEFIEKYL